MTGGVKSGPWGLDSALRGPASPGRRRALRPLGPKAPRAGSGRWCAGARRLLQAELEREPQGLVSFAGAPTKVAPVSATTRVVPAAGEVGGQFLILGTKEAPPRTGTRRLRYVHQAEPPHLRGPHTRSGPTAAGAGVRRSLRSWAGQVRAPASPSRKPAGRTRGAPVRSSAPLALLLLLQLLCSRAEKRRGVGGRPRGSGAARHCRWKSAGAHPAAAPSQPDGNRTRTYRRHRVKGTGGR